MSFLDKITQFFASATKSETVVVEKSALEIPSRHGETIYADFSCPPNPKAFLICVHGVKGFKDWGFWNPFAHVATQHGFAVLKFNFALNGMSGTDMENFPLLDNFARNTLSRELDDLQDVLNFVESPKFPSSKGDFRKQLYLVAHSRGGGIATLTTAKDPRIKKLVTWNAVGDYQARITETQVLDWESKGFIETENGRTKQIMRFNKTFLDDLTQNATALDVPKAASEIQVPWLIVHATDDTVVPFSNAEVMLNLNQSLQTELEQASGGHAFGATHPPKIPLPQSLLQVFECTLAFLSQTA